MKKFISVLLTLVIVLLTSGCPGSQETKSINVYFKSSESASIVPEKVKYSGSQNTVDMANFAVKKLIEGPDDPKFTRTLPEGTKLLGLTVKDSAASIDFSVHFDMCEGIDEILARFSVLRTLSDIPGITRVLITVNGNPLVSKLTGNEIGFVDKKDIVSDADVLDGGAETTTVTLYFATNDGTSLKTEARRVETRDTISIEKTIMNELVKGPSSPELNAVIPQGTKVLNIETKDGVCYVNLSQEFVSKFAGGTGILPVYAIVNSLCSIESVESVQILIDGEKGAEFGAFVFDEPMKANTEISKQ